MSGDTHPDDDADFLDEDFVVEDLSQGRDLDELFDEPAPAGEPAAAADGQEAEAHADADDLLFTDHTAKLAGDTPWQRDGFHEQADSNWDGENLDLESVGVPNASENEEQLFEDPQLEDARASFTAELDSMLQGEEEFALDSEAELEVIGGEADDGISEFEQSGPFVLDDGEGLWSDEMESAPAEAEAEPDPATAATVDDGIFELEEADDATPVAEAVGSRDPYAPMFGSGDLGEEIDERDGSTRPSMAADDEGAELEELQLYAASGGSDEGLEEGWEPLPGQSVDELAEVDEVQRSDEELREEAQSFTAPNFAPVEGAEQDLEDVEGHDIYDDGEDEDEAVVIGGPGSRRGRWAGIVGTLLAATVILGGGALVVAKPELFGLRIEPQRVERVDLPRPRVEFAVTEPPRPVESKPVEAPGNGGESVQPKPVEGSPESGTQGSGDPQVVEPQPPTTSVEPAEPQPAEPQAVEPQPAEPAPADPKPVEVLGQGDPHPVVTPVEPSAVAQNWPEDLGAVAQQTEPQATTEPGALARFGDGLLVGELGEPKQRKARAIDGVLPGSRAFAQLHNGNYFIGSVKQVAEQSVTLRVEDGGEITLATADIAQLTELGSSDFDELQKATRGFVRLTNNNRLVGGILSRIADD
ncbi:MAG: hypothetical protein KDC48_14975, partial [Planctomycetes bacterium]|nr:hypothetical protein [Planctomycetota bacterium]